MDQFNNTFNRVMRFIAAACAVCALTAHAQNNTDEQNGIQSLNVSGSPSGKLVLTVTLKHELASLPQHFTVNRPPRISLDFPNTTNNLGTTTQEFGQGDLRSVNVVQAGNRTRLVINLHQMMTYDTRIEGNNLLITLQAKASETAAAGTRFAEAGPGVQGHGVRGIDFHRGKNGEGRVEVDLSDPSIGIDIKQQGNKILIDFINTSLPRNLQRKLDVTDFGTPVDTIDAFTQEGNARVVVEPRGLWEQAAYQADNKFILEVKPKKPEEPTKKGGPQAFHGEKLTLNFQNIAVREALNVIADFTNLNIVISDSVSGNVTLRLRDVPWDQALDIILQSKGLDMRKNGNVIQVAPVEEIAAREKLSLTADQDIADLEPTRTESFVLSYQKGDDIVSLISNKDQRILSKRGSAVVDKRTNTLFVQDTPSRLEDIRLLLKQIDVPVRQVLIEARFVSAGSQFTKNLGGRLAYTGPTQQNGGGFAVGAGQRGTASGSVNLPGAASGNGGLTINLFNPSLTKTLTLELLASEIDGTTKNIASPRVVTADKNMATISSGVAIPYQQSTSSGATSVSFKDATLMLNVTPQITPDEHVDMKLVLNQDAVGTIYAGVPSINTKKVTTQVLVDNGGTVVIGGVYSQDTTDATTKVPLFGDIPILGWFFKNQTQTDNKNELLVFITPKILKESLNLN